MKYKTACNNAATSVTLSTTTASVAINSNTTDDRCNNKPKNTSKCKYLQ